MTGLNLDEFRRYLAIDKTKLDDEIVQQPSLFYAVSEALAAVIAIRDSLKEDLIQVDTEIAKEVRQRIGEKATDTRVKAEVSLDLDHQKAYAEWLKAKTEADKLEGLKESFKQRSYSLRALAELYKANFFEASTIRPSAEADRAVYENRRARLAAGREAKEK